MITLSLLIKRAFSLLELGDQDTFFAVLTLGAIISFTSSFLYGALHILSMLALITAESPLSDPTVTLITIIITILFAILSFFITIIGITSLAAATIRFFNQEVVPLRKIFTDSFKFSCSTRGLWIGLCTTLLFSFSTLGYIFLIIPGLILTLVTYFTLFRMIDFQEGFLHAISNSFGMLKRHYFTSCVFLIFNFFVITLLPLLSCGIGTFLSYSLNLVLPALLYASLLHKPIFSDHTSTPQLPSLDT